MGYLSSERFRRIDKMAMNVVLGAIAVVAVTTSMLLPFRNAMLTVLCVTLVRCACALPSALSAAHRVICGRVASGCLGYS